MSWLHDARLAFVIFLGGLTIGGMLAVALAASLGSRAPFKSHKGDASR